LPEKAGLLPLAGPKKSAHAAKIPALSYLGRVEPIRGYDDPYLSIRTPDVLARIQGGDASWEQMARQTMAGTAATAGGLHGPAHALPLCRLRASVASNRRARSNVRCFGVSDRSVQGYSLHTEPIC
jgi:hypothetical protein